MPSTAARVFSTAPDNRIEVKGRLNVPLTQTLAASLSGALVKQDGYVDQIPTGQELGDHNNLVGKLAVRWKGEDQELNFTVDGTRTREAGAAFVLRGVFFGSAIFNPQNQPLLPPGSPQTPGFYTINPPADIPVDNFSLFHNYLATLVTNQGNCLGLGSPTYNPQGDQKNPNCYGNQYVGEAGKVSNGTLRSISNDNLWGTHLTYDWNITDTLRIKSITAYRHLQSQFQRDGDESPLTIYHLIDELSQHQFSEELQIEGESFAKTLKWVGGIYYFDENAVNPNIVDFAPVTALSGGESANEQHRRLRAGNLRRHEPASRSRPAVATHAIARHSLRINTFSTTREAHSRLACRCCRRSKSSATFSKFTPLLNGSYHLTAGCDGLRDLQPGIQIRRLHPTRIPASAGHTLVWT